MQWYFEEYTTNDSKDFFLSEGKMLFKNITFNWKSNTSRYILVTLKIF